MKKRAVTPMRNIFAPGSGFVEEEGGRGRVRVRVAMYIDVITTIKNQSRLPLPPSPHNNLNPCFVRTDVAQHEKDNHDVGRRGERGGGGEGGREGGRGRRNFGQEVVGGSSCWHGAPNDSSLASPPSATSVTTLQLKSPLLKSSLQPILPIRIATPLAYSTPPLGMAAPGMLPGPVPLKVILTILEDLNMNFGESDISLSLTGSYRCGVFQALAGLAPLPGARGAGLAGRLLHLRLPPRCPPPPVASLAPPASPEHSSIA